jgi:hypothetical protein
MTAGLPPSHGAAGEPLPKPESTNDLPSIESPPLSPADENAQAVPESAIKMTDLMVFSPEASSRRVRFHFKPRHKRTVLPAAAVAIAAALGVVIGINRTSARCARDCRQRALGMGYDWSISYVRDGYVCVRGHGDAYQLHVGAPLPSSARSKRSSTRRTVCMWSRPSALSIPCMIDVISSNSDRHLSALKKRRL